MAYRIRMSFIFLLQRAYFYYALSKDAIVLLIFKKKRDSRNRIVFRSWINNYIYIKLYDVIIQPWLTSTAVWLNRLWGYGMEWASYQIRKIACCACTGNAGNVFPATDFKGAPLVRDPGMHHGTCVTNVPWWMSRSLTGGGRNIEDVIYHACPDISK